MPLVRRFLYRNILPLVTAFIPSFPSEPLSWKNFDPMSVLNEINEIIDLGLIKGTFERVSSRMDQNCIIAEI